MTRYDAFTIAGGVAIETIVPGWVFFASR